MEAQGVLQIRLVGRPTGEKEDTMNAKERNTLNRIYGLLEGLSWGATGHMQSDIIVEGLTAALEQLDEVLTGQKTTALVDQETIDRVRAEFKAEMEG